MFGRGRGEALVIHLGHGRWITVDSFIEPSSRQPIALQYLASIGVDPSAVEFVVATHWDKDHISGIARLIQAASGADVVLSMALRSPDFINLAFRHQQRTYASPLGSGTKEFVRLLELLAKQARAPRFVLQDTVLADRDGMRLVALSPSSSVALDALSAASVAALEAGSTGDSIVEPTPNAASVVLAIRYAGGRLARCRSGETGMATGGCCRVSRGSPRADVQGSTPRVGRCGCAIGVAEPTAV